MKEPIEVLSRIEIVEVSPFLFTRIKERIKQSKERITKTEAFSIAVPSLVIIVISLFLYLESNNKTRVQNRKIEFAKSMNLEVNNSIY